MRTPPADGPDLATVTAARDGDQRALDALAAASLPLVYNIVGRAMNGHPDTDDVVQETMLRAVRGVGDLRDPEAFRSWLVAIAIRQVRDSYRDRLARPPAVESDVPVPDFTDQTVERLGLSGQRLETAEATRWLDEDDRPVLALWWQEAAGQLARAELAAGLGISPAHAAVRVARMKERLLTSRTVVHALRRVPQCGAIAVIAAAWDGEPSPLWRKRLARHVRDCQWCLAGTADMIPAERLLAGLPLLAVPAGLAGRILASPGAPWTHAHPGYPNHPGYAGQPGYANQPGYAGQPPYGPSAPGTPGHGVTGPGAGFRAARHARHARMLSKGALSVQPKLIAASVAVVTCAAGGSYAVAKTHHPAAPAAIGTVSASAHPMRPVPLVTHSARMTPSPSATHSVKPPAIPSKTASASPAPPKTSPAASRLPASTPPAVTLTSQRKGVSTWNFTGVQQALAESGASWYYNWGTAPNGIAAPSGVSYVPMIWGAASVTDAALAQVRGEGKILLGFNEPDMAGQANMTPAQALALWPKLMATGMTLGSPAVAYGGDTAGGWLDQFMTGAKKDGYRVDFITVHWYGGDFRTGPAVQELQSYLQAIYDRYHLPIWLTEFALTSYSGGTATFPSESQQAAFLTAATTMLDGLSYVRRYAWFALPTSTGSGTTGLFDPGPSVTQVGRAFESAR
jgi:RNA polymerase sigma factor (sigma-70 family)